MKKKFLFLFIFSTAFCFAQNPIPNSGFDTYWPTPPGQPSGWTDSRDINQISPGYGGGLAAQGYKSATTYPAFITSSGGVGISISNTYAYFNLWFKYTSVSSDELFISVSVRDASQN